MPADPEYELYRALYREIESYLNHLLQIRRDYAREDAGVRVIFAIDYSEIHDYMRLGQRRSDLNAYVIDNSHAAFTLLPSAVGELLVGLQQDMKRSSLPTFGQTLYSYPEVARFVNLYPEGVRDTQDLIDLYAPAEARLKEAMGHLCHVAVGDEDSSGINRFLDLLKGDRIRPVKGMGTLGRVPPEMRQMRSLVEYHLSISRPKRTDNNVADASDLIVARMLCEQGKEDEPKYVPIYTQSTDLLSASTANESLLFDEDPLVRDIKYFQYRTRLRTEIRTAPKRIEKIEQLISICEKAKVRLGEVVRGPEHAEFWKSHDGARAAETAREFDEEVRRFLYYRVPPVEASEQPEERARHLFDALRRRREFEGRIDEACDVLKEQMAQIQEKLQAFAPNGLDPADVRLYKAKLQNWLAGRPVTAQVT